MFHGHNLQLPGHLFVAPCSSTHQRRGGMVPGTVSASSGQFQRLHHPGQFLSPTTPARVRASTRLRWRPITACAPWWRERVNKCDRGCKGNTALASYTLAPVARVPVARARPLANGSAKVFHVRLGTPNTQATDTKTIFVAQMSSLFLTGDTRRLTPLRCRPAAHMHRASHPGAV